MKGKHCLNSLIAHIDKIISGQSIPSSEYANCDEEYQELLGLAQLLAKAEYTSEKQNGKPLSEISKRGELADDDLDMVAGGLNANGLFEEKDKRNGK